MPKPEGDDVLSAHPLDLQAALDALDVIGQWDWDIPSDCVHADALVAQLFNVDPDAAQTGASLDAFVAGIHADDRHRVMTLIERCAREGGAYVAEYRVCSADGRTRWVLARGRFARDGLGRPQRGHGILVDITPSRLGEKSHAGRGTIDRDPAIGTAALDLPLERVADLLLAARNNVERIDNRRLKVLLDMILLEVGRALASLQRTAWRKSMN